MARITMSDDEIRIELSLWEKIFGLMGDRTIPRSAVTEVALETDPLRATRGLRAPGLGIPGSVKIAPGAGTAAGCSSPFDARRPQFVSRRRASTATRSS